MCRNNFSFVRTECEEKLSIVFAVPSTFGEYDKYTYLKNVLKLMPPIYSYDNYNKYTEQNMTMRQSRFPARKQFSPRNALHFHQ